MTSSCGPLARLLLSRQPPTSDTPDASLTNAGSEKILGTRRTCLLTAA